MENLILAPSILAADFSNLFQSVEKINEYAKNKSAQIHFDVMDGIFVPQISFGEPVLRAIKPLSSLPFDVHLMTERPENRIEPFIAAGADILTFHFEAAVHHNRLCEAIHFAGKKAGIAIVPSTAASAITEILPIVDLVLVMTVNPGFGGQKLLPQCLEKVKALKKIREKEGLNFKISVDGGIDERTIFAARDAGTDIAVSGTAFFSDKLQEIV